MTDEWPPTIRDQDDAYLEHEIRPVAEAAGVGHLLPPRVQEKLAEAGQRALRQGRLDIARIYDVPPWLMGSPIKRPRFARARWRLRKILPWLVWR